MSSAQQYLDDIINLHHEVLRSLREALEGLDSAALNWKPGPDTSSIGTIVVHALGADGEVLRNVLGIPTSRDRDAEFGPRTHLPEDLRKLIDASEDDWQTLAPRVGEEELRTSIPRPRKPVPQTGHFWLVRNYGHMREHLAQIQFTRQLYEAQAL